LFRRFYPTPKDNLRVMLFSQGGDTDVKSVEAWDIAPSNPW